MIAPSTWPRSTSSGGSFASSSTSAAEIVAALHDAAADLEHLRLAGRVGERLGHGDHVAVGLDERDRRRALEQREQRIRARGLGRAAGERVLDDVQPRPVLDQPPAQGVDLRHRQAAVVGDDQRLRARSFSVNSATTRSLSSFCTFTSSFMRSSPHSAAGSEEREQCFVLGGRLGWASAPVVRLALPAVSGDGLCY